LRFQYSLYYTLKLPIFIKIWQNRVMHPERHV